MSTVVWVTDSYTTPSYSHSLRDSSGGPMCLRVVETSNVCLWVRPCDGYCVGLWATVATIRRHSRTATDRGSDGGRVADRRRSWSRLATVNRITRAEGGNFQSRLFCYNFIRNSIDEWTQRGILRMQSHQMVAIRSAN